MYWNSQEDSDDTENTGTSTNPHSTDHQDQSANSAFSDDAHTADSDENPEDTDNNAENADGDEETDPSTPSETPNSSFSRNSTNLQNGHASRKPRSSRQRSSRKWWLRSKAKSSTSSVESQGAISSAEDMENLIAKRKKEKARALARRGLFSLFFEPKPL